MDTTKLDKLKNGASYAEIEKDMLALVPDDVDKRVGSIMFNTLAPTAYIVARQSYMLSILMGFQLFLDTATGEWLDRIADMFGRSREQPTQALRQINTFDTKQNPYDVPIGTRFAIDEVTFQLTERIDKGKYKAICQQSGTVGNWPRESLLPVDNIGGSFGYAQLVSDPLIPARDLETDDSLRERVYLLVRTYPYGGNKADYMIKAMDIPGVGNVAVFNAAVMGPGNVGLVITDDLGGPATDELINRVKEVVKQDGDGLAPVGHHPFVSTVKEKEINIIATLKLRESAQYELVEEKVKKALEEYISSISFEEDIVFYSKVIVTILDADMSIRDVTEVTINGGTDSIILNKNFGDFQVAKLGTVDLKEAEKRV